MEPQYYSAAEFFFTLGLDSIAVATIVVSGTHNKHGYNTLFYVLYSLARCLGNASPTYKMLKSDENTDTSRPV